MFIALTICLASCNCNQVDNRYSKNIIYKDKNISIIRVNDSIVSYTDKDSDVVIINLKDIDKSLY